MNIKFSELINQVKNCYGCYFKNGNTELELKYFIIINNDDYAIFKKSDNNFIVSHLNSFDIEKFTVTWCYGHYDFTSFKEAKNWIEKRS